MKVSKIHGLKGRKQSLELIKKRTEPHRNGCFFNCITCGKLFYRSKCHIISGNNKFCSRQCYFESELNKRKKPYISEIRKKQVGANNPSWKGGVTDINKKIRSSLEYKEWRLKVFERDNYTCVTCGFMSQKKKYMPIHAHHIKSFAKYPDVRFDIDNGITLCKECHKKTDNFCNNSIYHK